MTTNQFRFHIRRSLGKIKRDKFGRFTAIKLIGGSDE